MNGHDEYESSTVLLADEQGRALVNRPTLDDHDMTEFRDQSVGWRPKENSRSVLMPAVIHLAIFFSYTFLLTSVNNSNVSPAMWHGMANKNVFTPASEAVNWGLRRLHIGLNESNVFRGDPRQELDAAWDHLLSAVNIRIDEETLQKVGRTSAVALEDEQGGYIAELAVFHQLHCLRMIRASYTLDIYPYFQPLLAPKNGELIPLHLDHCIDALRQALMCKPDLTLLVSDWRDDYRNPWLDFGPERECMNWDNIFEWSKAHHVDWHGKLRHPKYGPTHWEEQPEAQEIDYSKLESAKNLLIRAEIDY